MALGTQAKRSTLNSKSATKSLNSSSKELGGITKALWGSTVLLGVALSPQAGLQCLHSGPKVKGQKKEQRGQG